MRTDLTIPSLVLLLGLLGCNAVAAPLGTAFTYQGRLSSADGPADGVYDFMFGLYDTAQGGNRVNTQVTNAAVHVSSGLFVVTLDFGTTAFLGDPRWLEIAVRTNGTGGFTTLTPRQFLAPTPYAISAGNLIGPLPSMQLSGAYPSKVTFDNPANSFGGNGAALTGVNASSLGGLSASSFWQLGGNAGTSAGPNFLGTTDPQPLEFRVGGLRLLRLEPNGNIIGGHSSNTIDKNMRYSVVSGGSNNIVQGAAATISGGYNNIIEDGAGATTIAGGLNQVIQFDADYSTISGGLFNTIQTNADCSTIDGGRYNNVQLDADVAVIGGGERNIIEADADVTTIGGGSYNLIRTNADYATIGGGGTNVIAANAGTIGGGYNNIIHTNANNTTIAGGFRNAIQNGAHNGAIGGGYYNIIGTNAQHATIPGGFGNTAGGSLSFAGGFGSQAMHDGTFMWSDSTFSGLRSWAANLFVVRASGGVHFFSNSGATVGTYMPAGGMGFSPTSDRNVKENFSEVDSRAILEKLVRLQVTEWNLISQPTNIRHIGPMAQDFKAAFGVGEDDRHISTTDADGVALAAIQGLYQMLNEKDLKLSKLEKEVAELKVSLNAILKNPKEELQ